MLEEMKELESNAVLATDIAAIDKQMKPLKALHLDSQRHGAEFSARFELMLKSYNEFVTLMSHKFVHWEHISVTNFDWLSLPWGYARLRSMDELFIWSRFRQ